MKALLIPNIDHDHVIDCTLEVAKQLRRVMIEPLVDQKLEKVFVNSNIQYLSFDEALMECDFILAIGGDGRMISCAQFAVQAGKPLCGVNVGRLGFLATIEYHELDRFKRLADGDYQLEPRMMIDLELKTDSDKTPKIYSALNEIVIANEGPLARMVEMGLYCENNFVETYLADGLIFATPTGSTAYALSAGGPVIAPVLNSINVTPICSHSLSGRSIIFPENATLSVRPKDYESCWKFNNKLAFTIDGREFVELVPNQTNLIKTSSKVLQLMVFSDRPFYKVMREKMFERSKSMIEEASK